MPTETQVIEWLWTHWPSVMIGLFIAVTYIGLYLRLKKFLDQIDKTEKLLIKHGKEMVQMKEKLALLILCHCKKPENKADMDTLMKFDPKDEE